MYNLQGFLALSALANNAHREVAPIGELSLYGGSFARDRRIFSSLDYPSITLFGFSSWQDVSATERVEVDVPVAVQTLARQIGSRLFALAESGDLTNQTAEVEAILLNDFGDQIQSIVVGEMVNDGNRWMPSFIIYEGTSTTAPYTARFWFSDLAFRQQYDEYEIDVVPMCPDIDALFGSAEEVEALIAEYMSTMAYSNKIRILADADPYTDQVTAEYEWRQPGRPDIRRFIPIAVVVYGEAGLNPDRRRKAIADWILANSKYDEDAWREIMPDVFSPTEFLFIPSWNRYAMPSGTIQDWSNGGIPQGVLSAGTYQPGGNVANQIPFTKKFAQGVGYTDAHIAAKLNLVTFVYKSVCVNIIGGYRNRDGVDEFLNRWTDYMAVGTGSVDFERMSEATQKMVHVVVDMLRIAETMTPTSTIPRSYMRVVRNGVMFLSADFERTQLFVVSRQSVAEFYQYTTGSQNLEHAG